MRNKPRYGRLLETMHPLQMTTVFVTLTREFGVSEVQLRRIVRE